MQYGINALIIVNGKDKTDSIISCNFRGGKCDVVYNNSAHVYSYNSTNVRILKLIQEIDPQSVIFKAKGRTYTEIDRILYFLILASGAAEQLPAHLPDTRQLSPATPACSSS